MFILGYDCITSSGKGVEALMAKLYSGFNNAVSVAPDGGKVCFLQNRNLFSTHFKEHFVSNFSELYKNILLCFSPEEKQNFHKKRVGVIFCSTKGCVEDYIWNEKAPLVKRDPYDSILKDFLLQNSETHFTFSCTLSNACSSSHVGIEYAQQLFDQDRLDNVLIIAGDLIGPFVYKGFNSLKVLTHTSNAPFDQSRSGLQLGDGFAALLLSKNAPRNSVFQIDGVASETEGALITRPSLNGEGLVKALQRAKSLSLHYTTPDFIIAHGTGTMFNDLTEDKALTQFFEGQTIKPIVTGTKWSVGHTLGASGLIDVIAACEVLKKQNLFTLGPTTTVDQKLNMNYFTEAQKMTLKFKALSRALVTSLGFGGIHAALFLSKTEVVK